MEIFKGENKTDSIRQRSYTVGPAKLGIIANQTTLKKDSSQSSQFFNKFFPNDCFFNYENECKNAEEKENGIINEEIKTETHQKIAPNKKKNNFTFETRQEY